MRKVGQSKDNQGHQALRSENREGWGLWHVGQIMTTLRELLPTSFPSWDGGLKHQAFYFIKRVRNFQLVACNILGFKY